MTHNSGGLKFWSYEIDDVLSNYTIILMRANELDRQHKSAHTQQLFYTIFNVYIPALESEATKFKQRFQAEREQKIVGGVMAGLEKMKAKDKRADQPKQGPLEPMSPVVILLKLAIEKEAISFVRDQNQDNKECDWGRLASFRRCLRDLKFVARHHNQTLYWPGLPSCIMVLAPIWMRHDVVISASNDRFEYSQPVYESCRGIREKSLLDRRSACNEDVQKRIMALEKISGNMKTWWVNTKKVERTIDNYHPPPIPGGNIPVYLPGILATWTPDGNYKPACFLDHVRFRAHRPPAAEQWEKKERDKNRHIYGVNSCAEWSGFLQLANLLDNNAYSNAW